LLLEPLYGALGWPQMVSVRRGWSRPKSFPRHNRGFRAPHVAVSNSEASRARAWPRPCFLARGGGSVALRGQPRPGLAPCLLSCSWSRFTGPWGGPRRPRCAGDGPGPRVFPGTTVDSGLRTVVLQRRYGPMPMVPARLFPPRLSSGSRGADPTPKIGWDFRCRTARTTGASVECGRTSTPGVLEPISAGTDGPSPSLPSQACLRVFPVFLATVVPDTR